MSRPLTPVCMAIGRQQTSARTRANARALTLGQPWRRSTARLTRGVCVCVRTYTAKQVLLQNHTLNEDVYPGELTACAACSDGGWIQICLAAGGRPAGRCGGVGRGAALGCMSKSAASCWWVWGAGWVCRTRTALHTNDVPHPTTRSRRQPQSAPVV